MPVALKFSGNSSFYLFLIDISKKRGLGEFDSVQSEYLDLLARLQRTATETLATLPHDHPWCFVFDLLREQSNVLVEALSHGPLEDHTQRLRHLADVYNALVEVRPWRPPKNRLLAWFNAPSGWKDRIRCLVFENPPDKPEIKESVRATLTDIERLLHIANEVTAVWGS